MKLFYFAPKPMLAMVVLLAIVSPRGAMSAQQPPESSLELVRRTVQREVTASNGNTKVMFLDRKETPHGSQTKMIVETRDGMAGILVAVNDKPLAEDQRQAEEDHLARLVNNPDELAKKRKSEKEDAERITRIIKALPDALLYEPDGTEVGTQEMGKAGEELVRLRVHPNPKYSPPTHVEQVLTGMQGYILIDAEQHRIAKIDGTLAKDVGFGWGFLGHLNKGGHFLVMQAEIMKGDWEVTRMSLGFTGKVLMFKSLNIKSDEVFSNFRPVPANLTFAQGIELLKKQEAELAENRQQAGADSHK
jgi:hypothetical protein